MKLKTSFLLCFLVAVAVSSHAANAFPVQYQIEGLGFGMFGGNPFQMAPFTLRAEADTSDIMASSGGTAHVILNDSLTLTIEGVGTGTFLEQTLTATDNIIGQVGFGGITTAGVPSSVVTVDDSSFITYDLSTPLPPTSGDSTFNSVDSFSTTFGDLNWDAVINVSFTAAIVPEPTSVVLFAVAALCLVGLRRKSLRD